MLWLSEQPLTAKMIFKWFLQEMDIIDSTIYPSFFLLSSLHQHPFNCNSCGFFPSTVAYTADKHYTDFVMWQSCCPSYGSFLSFNFRYACPCLSCHNLMTLRRIWNHFKGLFVKLKKCMKVLVVNPFMHKLWPLKRFNSSLGMKKNNLTFLNTYFDILLSDNTSLIG